MAGRLRHFHANTGTLGVIQTVVVHAACFALPLYVLTRDDADEHGFSAALLLGITVAWTLPFLLRDRLVEHVERVKPILNAVAVAMFAAAFFSGPLRARLGDPVVMGVVLPTAAAYISAFWWLLSDPRIVKQRR